MQNVLGKCCTAVCGTSMPKPSTQLLQLSFVNPPSQNPTHERYPMSMQFSYDIQGKNLCLFRLSVNQHSRKVFQVQTLIEQHTKILALLTKTITVPWKLSREGCSVLSIAWYCFLTLSLLNCFHKNSNFKRKQGRQVLHLTPMLISGSIS